jgi:chromosomal replication initiator protein
MTNDFFEQFLNNLKETIGAQNFNLWFSPSNININDNTIIFSVPNKFYKDIIIESYKEIILNLWKKYSNDKLNILFNINEEIKNNVIETKISSLDDFFPSDKSKSKSKKNKLDLDNENINNFNNNTAGENRKDNNTNNGFGSVNETYGNNNNNTNSDNDKDKKTELSQSNQLKNIKKHYLNLNTKYTFENFVIGSGNQFAHAACFAVANLPGHTYNPMFIYSDVGLGKTHLLNAIGNKIIEEKQLNVFLVSSEQFTNEMISSIRDDKMVDFRNKYRNVDVLLIDDIQFIAGKERTQEEFFYTFNALYENQKQIVVSSDKIPRNIVSLEERLRSRFEWGLIADIQPPDFETRVAILKKKAFLNKIDMSDEIIYFIASKISNNIRELEGALIKVAAFSSFTGKKITLDLSREALSNLIKEEEKPMTAEIIIKTVCNFFNIKIPEIKSNKKLKEFVLPRQIAMYIIRTNTSLSFPEIGDKFGGKDHSSVIYAVDKIKKNLIKDKELEKTIQTIIKIIQK